MDVFAPEERSRIMSRVRSAHTKPEVRVRARLHRLGLRFRLHDSRLPGRPDLVFRRWRAVVFVNGCFWHGHAGCPRAALPASRPEFWSAKIARNRERDRMVRGALRELGWLSFDVWQCQISDEMLDELGAAIRQRRECAFDYEVAAPEPI